MWQRFTENARKVVYFAQEEAGSLLTNEVSTEHLLLGILRIKNSSAYAILAQIGISADTLRATLVTKTPKRNDPIGQDMTLTPSAKRVIDLAYEEARQMGSNHIGSEQILLALIREEDGIASQVLVELGVGLEATRAELQKKSGRRNELGD